MISLFAIATVLMLSACGGGSDPKPDPEPDPDTTKPVIATVVPTASQAFGINGGGSFMYEGTFTDNEELKSVVFSLDNSKPAPAAGLKAATGVDDDPWEPTDVTVTLSGKSQKVDQAIFTNPTVDVWTGTYTLTVTCTDKADNVATETISVEIE
ncbi:DUF4625 domain-containing protein [Labilibacter marinus]|uniref:DUF4625 domain-containing protein n=1 Tax=Labilibacter marinus TaxID=1477105 RepID=UPI00094FE8F7|nr:DUF4625 domain-containing protein [Labilibacter marinus]